MTPFWTFSLSDIATTIQVAIAPIFLLVATGSILNVVTTRLGRVIDRARALEAAIESGEDAVRENRHVGELQVLDQRMKLGNRAVLFCCLSAVLICILVAMLFLAELFRVPAGVVVAGLFVAVVTSLMVGLVTFLREVSIATNALRVRNEILTRKRRTGEGV